MAKQKSELESKVEASIADTMKRHYDQIDKWLMQKIDQNTMAEIQQVNTPYLIPYILARNGYELTYTSLQPEASHILIQSKYSLWRNQNASKDLIDTFQAVITMISPETLQSGEFE